SMKIDFAICSRELTRPVLKCIVMTLGGMMRGIRFVLNLSLFAFMLGCGPQKETADNGAGPAKTGSAATAAKVAQVTDVGGIEDKSFNASAWAGLQKA